jgi:hypothetical protein
MTVLFYFKIYSTYFTLDLQNELESSKHTKFIQANQLFVDMETVYPYILKILQWQILTVLFVGIFVENKKNKMSRSHDVSKQNQG